MELIKTILQVLSFETDKNLLERFYCNISQIDWISNFARKQKWRKFEYLTSKNNIISILISFSNSTQLDLRQRFLNWVKIF